MTTTTTTTCDACGEPIDPTSSYLTVDATDRNDIAHAQQTIILDYHNDHAPAWAAGLFDEASEE